MILEGVDRKELEALAEAGALVTISASQLLAVIVRFEQLEEKVASLESNSRNSSKPPSSDRHNPNKPKKPRGKKGKRKRKPGGQKGRTGKTLKQVADPDHVEDHKLDRRGGKCDHCQGSLRGAESTGFEKRQVFDLPKEITIEVTEHRAETGICPCCSKKVKASFPEEVTAPVQYGERIQTLVIYLHTYQLLPCERLGEFFGDVFGCSLCPEPFARCSKRGARAGPIYEAIKSTIIQAVFLHCDETGLSISGKLHWLHTASTPELVYLHIDKHRGEAALRAMGILEGFEGWVVHDFLSAYYRIDGLKHVLCNAHLLRDLICVHEDHGQSWAADMMALLLEAKSLKTANCPVVEPSGPRHLSACTNATWKFSRQATQSTPNPSAAPGQRGRLKRGKPLNLLMRLDERSDEVMAFLVHAEVPFDNNEAERDLRMMKIKQKISGCFRSIDHGRAFAKLRSIIASAKSRRSTCSKFSL
ncbi:MAG: IS66 family transposase [Verrucomicrobiales bacterium]